MTDNTPATTDDEPGPDDEADGPDADERQPHEIQIDQAKAVAGHLLGVATAASQLDRDNLRSFCYDIAARADEWSKAAADLEAVGPTGLIVPVGSIVPGMHVPSWSADDSTWVPVKRITRNDQIGLLVLVVDRGITRQDWRNLMSPTSPLVVRR